MNYINVSRLPLILTLIFGGMTAARPAFADVLSTPPPTLLAPVAGPSIDYQTLWSWSENREKPVWAIANCHFDAAAAVAQWGVTPEFAKDHPGVNPFSLIPAVIVSTYGSEQKYLPEKAKYSKLEAQKDIRARLAETCVTQMDDVIANLKATVLTQLTENDASDLRARIHIDAIDKKTLSRFDSKSTKLLTLKGAGTIDDWGFTKFPFELTEAQKLNAIANLNASGSCSRVVATGQTQSNCVLKHVPDAAVKLASFRKTRVLRLLGGAVIGAAAWSFRGGSIPTGSTFLARVGGAIGMAGIRWIVMGRDAKLLDSGVDAATAFIAESGLQTKHFLVGGTSNTLTKILAGTYYGAQTGFLLAGPKGIPLDSLMGLVYLIAPTNPIAELASGALIGFNQAHLIAAKYEHQLEEDAQYDYNEVKFGDFYSLIQPPVIKEKSRARQAFGSIQQSQI